MCLTKWRHGVYYYLIFCKKLKFSSQNIRKIMNVLASTISHKNSLRDYEFGIVLCHITQNITWWRIYSRRVPDESLAESMGSRNKFISAAYHLKFKRYHLPEVNNILASFYFDPLGNLYHVEAREVYQNIINNLSIIETVIAEDTSKLIAAIHSCKSLFIGESDVGRPPHLNKYLEILSTMAYQSSPTVVNMFLHQALRRCRDIAERADKIRGIVYDFKYCAMELIYRKRQECGYREECLDELPEIIAAVYDSYAWGKIFLGIPTKIGDDTIVNRLCWAARHEFVLDKIIAKVRAARPDVFVATIAPTGAGGE
jgi:hypothetical protein